MKKSIAIPILILTLLLYGCNQIIQILQPSTQETTTNADSEDSPGLLENLIGPTVTPTLSQEMEITEADYAFFSGQLEEAKQLYQSAFANSTSNDEKAAALYGLGRTYYREKNYIAAIDAFNRIFGQYPDSMVTANAYFMIAEAYYDIGEFQVAADSYARYVALNPLILDNFVMTLAGDASFESDNFSQAIYHYQYALKSNPPGNAAYLNLQIGEAYAGIGDHTTAIQYYTTVYDTVEDGFSKSTANLLMGRSYLELGLEEEAYFRLMDSVIQFPQSYDSYTALTILLDNGVPVNDFFRGLVDYYAARIDPTLYEPTIQAFERYLASNPENNDGSVHYFKGLSHYFRNEPREAINEYEMLINNYPANPYWPNAWDEKGFVQWALLGEYSNAAETYLGFVTNAPTSPEAAKYLYEAARIYERAEDLEAAAAVWQRLITDYPSEDASYRGLFLAGISYFRLGRFDEALAIFQRTLVLGTNPGEKAKSYLWIGKCHQSLGQNDDAQSAWELGESSDPTDYYSIRAGQLNSGIDPFTIEGDFDLGYELNYERFEAEEWLRTTFSIPLETDLSSLGELAGNIHIQRMNAFWDLGLIARANEEADILRVETRGDVVQSFRLMNQLISLHLYQPAIYISRDILDLAGLDDLGSLSAPIYFTHIRFGSYFKEMIVPIALEFEVHPLVLLSLVRQESLFNPYIGSSAGAIGLAQLIPATAKENVDLLNWPENYDFDSLYLGEINLTLGTYYLQRMKNYFSGNLQVALAAYNAGPGNAEAWYDLANKDPDLFLEVIRALETQNYLKQITEFLNINQLLYTRPQ
jgi:soluble lytic murein transglycosylase